MIWNGRAEILKNNGNKNGILQSRLVLQKILVQTHTRTHIQKHAGDTDIYIVRYRTKFFLIKSCATRVKKSATKSSKSNGVIAFQFYVILFYSFSNLFGLTSLAALIVYDIKIQMEYVLTFYLWNLFPWKINNFTHFTVNNTFRIIA